MNALHCYETISEGLIKKGVIKVLDCPVEGVKVKSIGELRDFVSYSFHTIFFGASGSIIFESNEPIGSTHTLHGFRIYVGDTGKYLGVRAVIRGNDLIRLLFTIPREIGIELKGQVGKYSPQEDIRAIDSSRAYEKIGTPPGQFFIDLPIIYNILGVPQVDASKWSLKVMGEVENPVELTLKDLYELGIKELTVDFHCVTGWSVKSMSFAGTPLTKIIELVKPRQSAQWIYVESLDKYTTIIQYSEVQHPQSIVAVEMGGKPLDILHGYPARLLIPHLYGWKSAKWVSRILFTSRYVDGYWESLGYHPRGLVWEEERFKLK